VTAPVPDQAARAPYEAARRAFEGTGDWEMAVEAALAAERQRTAKLTAELGEMRADMAAARDLLDLWPLCPDGCGCRLGTDDPDARECACDGPCCMECRETGYPDAPSYRDIPREGKQS
jgi:hypothetical protein